MGLLWEQKGYSFPRECHVNIFFELIGNLIQFVVNQFVECIDMNCAICSNKKVLFLLSLISLENLEIKLTQKSVFYLQSNYHLNIKISVFYNLCCRDWVKFHLLLCTLKVFSSLYKTLFIYIKSVVQMNKVKKCFVKQYQCINIVTTVFSSISCEIVELCLCSALSSNRPKYVILQRTVYIP